MSGDYNGLNETNKLKLGPNKMEMLLRDLLPALSLKLTLKFQVCSLGEVLNAVSPNQVDAPIAVFPEQIDLAKVVYAIVVSRFHYCRGTQHTAACGPPTSLVQPAVFIFSLTQHVLLFVQKKYD